MNTHLRRLIQELRAQGWEYQATQTNGAPHFAHPDYGRVAVASTPADWEDECRFTLQRIRKAERRRQVAVSENQVAEQENPFASIFAQIQDLETELEQIRERLPAMSAEVHQSLEPLYAQMGEQRRELLQWLGSQLCNPGLKKRQRESLGELCLAIADSAKQRLGIDLSPELEFLRVLEEGKAIAGAVQEGEDSQLDENFDAFGEADWEKWFEHHESQHTYIPEKPPPKPKARKAPPRKSAELPDPEVLQKRLYLGLARELHPDKTTDEEERHRRTHLMQRLNAAYGKKDLRTLLHLLQEHGKDVRAGLDQGVQESLRASLEKQRSDLEASIRKELAGLPPIEGSWRKVVANPKLWERQLRTQRREAEDELARFRSLTREIQRPRGLQDFLRDSDAWDWQELF